MAGNSDASAAPQNHSTRARRCPSASLYEGDCLTFKAFTPNRLIVGMQKGLFPDHDVECRIALDDADPDGNEGSVECSGLVIIPEEEGEEAQVEDEGSVECSTQ